MPNARMKWKDNLRDQNQEIPKDKERKTDWAKQSTAKQTG